MVDNLGVYLNNPSNIVLLSDDSVGKTTCHTFYCFYHCETVIIQIKESNEICP